MLGVSPLLAQLLAARGCATPEAARRFLNPDLSHLHSPFELRDMDCAAARLKRAIDQRERIEIHGDYDVDGTTSVTILKTAIEMAGGQCAFRIPHRLRDGYGMQLSAIEEAAASGVKLIVSVDTGIRAHAIVDRARQLGLDVIVTDHHLPEDSLPRAVAVINPNRPDCAYPNKDLCGVGVAFKLAEALLSQLPWEPAKLRRVLDSLLKLVAIGTIADVVQLRGENRAIVKLGLAGLRVVNNPGLRALLDVSGVNPGEPPTPRQVGFQIGPRINAAGRMSSAAAVVEMFLTREEPRAREIAAELDRLNNLRRNEEDEIKELCLSEPVDDSQFCLVFNGEGWHRGVLGIVASRVVEKLGRPTIVLGEQDGESAGSARSIPGFHLLDALESMRDLFIKFGGHSHAAGMTLRSDRVGELRARLNAYAAARLTPADLRPGIEIDAIAPLEQCDERLFAGLQSLEPFGSGNRAPIFAALDVEVDGELRLMKEKHIRVNLRQGKRSLPFVAFNFAERAEEFARGRRVDVAFGMEEDKYNGGCSYIVKDVRAARS